MGLHKLLLGSSFKYQKQNYEHMTEAEGRSVTLQCKYKTDSPQDYLFWYIQRANDFPKYILRRTKYGGEDTDAQFQERFDSKVSSNSVPLTIKDVRVSDSAVYFCALRPTVRKLKSNHIQKHELNLSQEII
uniref:Ig-like domain-containing protein n=1 Tax=Cyprinus carpio carpio TaxID=630221 RepID=A0A8C1B4Q0_CYPCA